MTQRSPCTCPVCEIELALLGEIHRLENDGQYPQFTLRSPVLSVFSTYDALGVHLRRLQTEPDHGPSSDEILKELLRLSREYAQQLGHNLILLTLMPAIHKTSRDIAIGFPALSRDDIAQHLLTAILEALHVEGFTTRQSHYAFALSRQMRRSAFRWAIRESRLATAFEPERSSAEKPASNLNPDFEARVVLRDFLQRCLGEGLICEAEYEQLEAFKIARVPSPVLAARAGLSEIAFRHRVQRVVEKLRQAAGKLPVLPPRRKPARPALSSSSSHPERNSAA